MTLGLLCWICSEVGGLGVPLVLRLANQRLEDHGMGESAFYLMHSACLCFHCSLSHFTNQVEPCTLQCVPLKDLFQTLVAVRGVRAGEGLSSLLAHSPVF